MKGSKIVIWLCLLIGLWTILIWNDPFNNPLNGDLQPQNEDLSVISALEFPQLVVPSTFAGTKISRTDQTFKKEYTELYTVIVIENCEYFQNIHNVPPQIAHKGNCRNLIHPENTVDWVKFNKLLNSSLLTNILKP